MNIMRVHKILEAIIDLKSYFKFPSNILNWLSKKEKKITITTYIIYKLYHKKKKLLILIIQFPQPDILL